MRTVLRDAAARFYRADRNCPLGYEPSGQDFLSPCLAEADFMRRVLGRRATSRAGSPASCRGIPAQGRGGRRGWSPGVVTDRADPKLAHIDGLNLSRAWMLEGIAGALPAKRCAARRAAGRRCRAPGSRAAAGYRRALRGRPLARHVRGVSDQRRGREHPLRSLINTPATAAGTPAAPHGCPPGCSCTLTTGSSCRAMAASAFARPKSLRSA